MSIFSETEFCVTMATKRYSVSGYDEFKQKVTELEASGEVVNVYFTGSKDESGSSWCPDCNDGK